MRGLNDTGKFTSETHESHLEVANEDEFYCLSDAQYGIAKDHVKIT